MENTDFLNAYQIMDPAHLIWPVATYQVVPIGGDQAQHEDRGKAKDIIWQLRMQYRDLCKGYGFVVDIDETTVAVPSNWEIPEQSNFNGYKVCFNDRFDTQPTNPLHEAIIKGILRESVKKHFKEIPSYELGELWQDYGDFCQFPSLAPVDSITSYCKKFVVTPELLKNDIWVLKLEVVTKLIDSRTLFDYYQYGEVKDLAEMINAKRTNRLNRKNEPTAIRVLYTSDSRAEVLELEKPDDILDHALLDPADQKKKSDQLIDCKKYKKPSTAVPLNQLRLILDTLIVRGDHDETIVDPKDRFKWYSILRNYLNGMDAYQNVINLAADPISENAFESVHILPPALLIRTSPTGIGILPAPSSTDLRSISARARERSNAIKQNGYLEQRPINPILVCPVWFGETRAVRLQNDLNYLLNQQGLNFKFSPPVLYRTVHDIAKAVEKGSYDSLFAVLPEGSYSLESDSDMHDQIKKRIGIPSQCIHHDNTLSPKWAGRPWRDLKSMDPHYARRVQNQYLLCIQNLLVKHHWVPFAPATPFNYNVHVGIDVGGKHNNRVMASIGYGFMNPSEGLVFLPKEIQIDTQKAEPIPTKYLHDGLFSLFDELYYQLKDAGIQPDFNRILFLRDGVFRGQGDAWNEFDALTQLRKKLANKGWINADSVWTAAEISKRAAEWRVLRSSGGDIVNPVVGKCFFPFRDTNAAIVCTTGSPYLSQGTASPLMVKIKEIQGEFTRDQVLLDIIWESDMCFTKLDMAMSLPWVLHIADTGALQQSKAYKITGITV